MKKAIILGLISLILAAVIYLMKTCSAEANQPKGIGAGNVNTEEGNEYYIMAKKAIGKYNPPRKDYAIIVDYRKNIFSKRLFVIDLHSGSVVIKCKVSHAFKSGLLYATDFSNVIGSKKSSQGNYLTSITRPGKFGYSMEITGLDKRINDNVKARSIIFHSDKKMVTFWSDGCFATNDNINKKLIDLTHDGCLVSVIIKN